MLINCLEFEVKVYAMGQIWLHVVLYQEFNFLMHLFAVKDGDFTPQSWFFSGVSH